MDAGATLESFWLGDVHEPHALVSVRSAHEITPKFKTTSSSDQRRVVELSEAVADGLEEASVLSTAVEELDRITYSDVRQAVACAAAVRCRTSKEVIASYRAVPELLTHVSLKRRGLEYLLLC